MCQHGPERDIADALDTLCASVELVVDDDASALVGLDTDRLEVEALGDGTTTDSDENDVCLKLHVSWNLTTASGQTVSSLPPFAASTCSLTVSPCTSAPMTLVLSLNLRPCFAKIFWNAFLPHQSE